MTLWHLLPNFSRPNLVFQNFSEPGKRKIFSRTFKNLWTACSLNVANIPFPSVRICTVGEVTTTSDTWRSAVLQRAWPVSRLGRSRRCSASTTWRHRLTGKPMTARVQVTLRQGLKRVLVRRWNLDLNENATQKQPQRIPQPLLLIIE